MNVHILLVMKYRDDNDSVTAQELLDNHKAAHAAYDAYSAYANYIAYSAYVSTYAVDDAKAEDVNAADDAKFYAAKAATAAAAADINCTKNKVGDYFDITGENKQDYLDELTKNKGDK